MKRLLQLTVLTLGVGIAGAGTASAQANCDRACLRTMLDQYLNAVVKHDPAAAPLDGRLQADGERHQRPAW